MLEETVLCIAMTDPRDRWGFGLFGCKTHSSSAASLVALKMMVELFLKSREAARKNNNFINRQLLHSHTYNQLIFRTPNNFLSKTNGL